MYVYTKSLYKHGIYLLYTKHIDIEFFLIFLYSNAVNQCQFSGQANAEARKF